MENVKVKTNQTNLTLQKIFITASTFVGLVELCFFI